jgi:hypothetical protein
MEVKRTQWRQQFDFLFSIIVGQLDVSNSLPRLQAHADELRTRLEKGTGMDVITEIAEELAQEHQEELDQVIIGAMQRATFIEHNELAIRIPPPDGRISF